MRLRCALRFDGFIGASYSTVCCGRPRKLLRGHAAHLVPDYSSKPLRVGARVNLFSLALAAGGWIAFVSAFAGVAYTVLASFFVSRFFFPKALDDGAVKKEALTVLKPLHGDEPRLSENLRSFCDQDYPAPVQIVFGVGAADDSARPVAEALIGDARSVDASLCIDTRTHGRNAKISNLINMTAEARHPIIVISDSDIGAPPDYLRRVQRALAESGVGVVTCPYYGRGEAGFWSDLAAMAIDYQFLPNVISGVTLRLAAPCMGSTVALRRETLDRIGGFEAFRDVLADDYAIGEAVRRLGLTSIVAPVLVSHDCVERSFGDVFVHELRWARTVRSLDPAGHAGSVVTHTLALALLAALLLDFSAASLILFGAAFGARVWLMRIVDGHIGRRLGAWGLLPIRDMLSFAVFVGSFFGRSVEWRGAKFHVTNDGDLEPR